MFIFGKPISVGKFALKNNFVSEMGRKKYSVSTLCLKNCYFCRTKIMSRQVVEKKNSAALGSEKKYFDSDNNHSPPFKLNGCSLSFIRST